MTKSTLSKVQRRLPRDPFNGKFEPASPLNDPLLLRHVLEVVGAADRLMPALLAFMHGAGSDPAARALMRTTLCGLVFVRESLLHHLDVDAKAASDVSVEVDLERLVLSVQANWAGVFAAIDKTPRLQSVPTDKGPT